MSVTVKALAATVVLSLGACSSAPATDDVVRRDSNIALLDTSLGRLTMELFPADAPATVDRFKGLVRSGFYDGKPFFRVVAGHVIQAGATESDSYPGLPLELTRHLHVVGAVGMARALDPDSATTQFYVCLAPRPHLDGRYTIFAQLVTGFEVLEQIANVEVEQQFVDGVAFHRPKRPVVIERTMLLDELNHRSEHDD